MLPQTKRQRVTPRHNRIQNVSFACKYLNNAFALTNPGIVSKSLLQNLIDYELNVQASLGEEGETSCSAINLLSVDTLSRTCGELPRRNLARLEDNEIYFAKLRIKRKIISSLCERKKNLKRVQERFSEVT